jgi:hypothetical protein
MQSATEIVRVVDFSFPVTETGIETVVELELETELVLQLLCPPKLRSELESSSALE